MSITVGEWRNTNFGLPTCALPMHSVAHGFPYGVDARCLCVGPRADFEVPDPGGPCPITWITRTIKSVTIAGAYRVSRLNNGIDGLGGTISIPPCCEMFSFEDTLVWPDDVVGVGGTGADQRMRKGVGVGSVFIEVLWYSGFTRVDAGASANGQPFQPNVSPNPPFEACTRGGSTQSLYSGVVSTGSLDCNAGISDIVTPLLAGGSDPDLVNCDYTDLGEGPGGAIGPWYAFDGPASGMKVTGITFDGSLFP